MFFYAKLLNWVLVANKSHLGFSNNRHSRYRESDLFRFVFYHLI